MDFHQIDFGAVLFFLKGGQPSKLTYTRQEINIDLDIEYLVCMDHIMYSSMNNVCIFALYVIQYTNNVGHLEVKMV